MSIRMASALPDGVSLEVSLGSYHGRVNPEMNWVIATVQGSEFYRDGAQVGYLGWWASDGDTYGEPHRAGEIISVQTDPEYQRQGIATAMWNLAKSHEPRLHHSETLTEDGQAWAERVGSLSRSADWHRGMQVMINAKDPRALSLLSALASGATNAARDRLIELMAGGTGYDPWTGNKNGPRTGAGGWWTTDTSAAWTYASGIPMVGEDDDAIFASVILHSEISEDIEAESDGRGYGWHHLEPGTPLTLVGVTATLPNPAQARILLDLARSQGGWWDPMGMADLDTWVNPGLSEPYEIEEVMYEWPLTMRTMASLSGLTSSMMMRYVHEPSRSEYGGIVVTDPRMVAYDDEREVGSLDWDARDPRLFGTVRVDPAYRGRGIATRLFEEAKKVNPDLDPETSVFFTPAGRGWVDSLTKTAVVAWQIVERDALAGWKSAVALDPGAGLEPDENNGLRADEVGIVSYMVHPDHIEIGWRATRGWDSGEDDYTRRGVQTAIQDWLHERYPGVPVVSDPEEMSVDAYDFWRSYTTRNPGTPWSRKTAGPASNMVPFERFPLHTPSRGLSVPRDVKVLRMAEQDIARLHPGQQARVREVIEDLRSGRAEIEPKSRPPLVGSYSVRATRSLRVGLYLSDDQPGGDDHRDWIVYWVGDHNYQEAERRMWNSPGVRTAARGLRYGESTTVDTQAGSMTVSHEDGVYPTGTVGLVGRIDGVKVSELFWWGLPEGEVSDGMTSEGEGVIWRVWTSEVYRRQGLASILMRMARDTEPGLRHSDVLTDDGRAWSEKVGSLPEGIVFEHRTDITALGKPSPKNSIQAILDGTVIGHLLWWTDFQAGPMGHQAGEIVSVDVKPEHHRRGIATEMLRRAREIEPRVHHSHALTDDGRAWSQAVGCRTASQPAHLLDQEWEFITAQPRVQVRDLQDLARRILTERGYGWAADEVEVHGDAGLMAGGQTGVNPLKRDHLIPEILLSPMALNIVGLLHEVAHVLAVGYPWTPGSDPTGGHDARWRSIYADLLRGYGPASAEPLRAALGSRTAAFDYDHARKTYDQVRSIAKKYTLWDFEGEARGLLRRVLTEAGFPRGEHAEVKVLVGRPDLHGVVAWDLNEGLGTNPLVMMSMQSANEFVLLHEAAHILRNGPSAIGRVGADVDDAHDQRWWDTFTRLIGMYATPLLANAFRHLVLKDVEPGLLRAASADLRGQVAAWEATRPWQGSRDEIASGIFPGITVGQARGTELASYRDGKIILKDEWFSQPEGARRAILYHEAGHGLADDALPHTADVGLGSPLDLIRWPKASWLGHNYDEIVAEGYSVIWTEPGWFDDAEKGAVRDLVIAMARRHGYPLPRVTGSLEHTAASDETWPVADVLPLRMNDGRKVLNPDQVAKYVEDIRAGVPLAPLFIERGPGGAFLSDGHHRLEAAERAGLTEIPVRVFDDRWEALKALNEVERAKTGALHTAADLMLHEDVYYRVHHLQRAFSVDDAWSAPLTVSFDDDLDEPREGYSACRTPWDLWGYVVLQSWVDRTARDEILIFSGDEIGEGIDGEPLVIPDFRVQRWLSWRDFLWALSRMTGRMPDSITGPLGSMPLFLVAKQALDQDPNDPVAQRIMVEMFPPGTREVAAPGYGMLPIAASLGSRMASKASLLPDVGPTADTYWGEGGCGAMALAFVTMFPELKIAVEWGTGHDEGYVWHTVAYDPTTKRSFDFNGTGHVDIEMGLHGGDVEMDVAPQRVADAMDVLRGWTAAEPWANDLVFEASGVIEDHWGLDDAFWNLGSLTASAYGQGGTIYRGLRVSFPPDVDAKVRDLLGIETDEDSYERWSPYGGKKVQAGEIIVRALEGSHWDSGVGLGRHWSERWEMAQIGAQQGGSGDWGIILTATYGPEDVDPDSDPSRPFMEAESEVTLRPGASITITDVQVRWHQKYESVFYQPMEAVAGLRSTASALVETISVDRAMSMWSAEYDSPVSGVEADLRQADAQDGKPDRLDEMADAVYSDWDPHPVDVLMPPPGEEADGDTLIDGHHRVWAVFLGERKSIRARVHPCVVEDGVPTWPTYYEGTVNLFASLGSVTAAAIDETHQEGIYYHVTRADLWRSVRRDGLRPSDHWGHVWLFRTAREALRYSEGYSNPDVPPVIVVVRTERAVPTDMGIPGAYWVEGDITPGEIYDVIRADERHHYSSDYRMTHQPDPDGPPLHDLLWSDMVPRDVYDHPDYYTGFARDQAGRDAIEVIRRVRGNPDAMVTIYRSLPPNVPQEINPGDWITLSRSYAEMHGEGRGWEEWGTLDEPNMFGDTEGWIQHDDDWPVISRQVPAWQVRWDVNDLVEMGWFPNATRVASLHEGAIAPERQGQCYPLAYEHLMTNDDGSNALVHGTINGGATNHAWVEWVDTVYDPVLDEEFTRDFYYTNARAVAEQTYTADEAEEEFETNGHYGPWDGSVQHTASSLSLEDYISVAEEAVERGYPKAGELWHLADKSNFPKAYENPDYWEAMRPVKDFVMGVLSRAGKSVHKDFKVIGDGWHVTQDRVQGATDGANWIDLRSPATLLTILHECAHVIRGTGEGAGHDAAFVDTLAGLLDAWVSPAAAEQFRHLVGFHDEMKAVGSRAEVTYRVVYRDALLSEGEAMVVATVDGWDVGALRWDYYSDPPVIVDVSVEDEYRRQGIATEMFRLAREKESRLVHSDVLSDDGRGWMQAVGATFYPEDLHLRHRKDSLHGFIDREWIEAWVGPDRVGFLYWYPTIEEIGEVKVEEGYRRNGIATKMLQAARQVCPDLKHSDILSEDGRAWMETVGSRATTLYHLTDTVDFRLDPNYRPQNNTTWGGDLDPRIFLSPRVETWANGYGYWRPWVVEFSVDPAIYDVEGATGGYGGEVEVHAENYDMLRITRVLPLDAWARETYGEFGWVEEHFGVKFDTGEPIEVGDWSRPLNLPRGYRYPGDARRESAAWQSEYAAKVEQFRLQRGPGVYVGSRTAKAHVPNDPSRVGASAWQRTPGGQSYKTSIVGKNGLTYYITGSFENFSAFTERYNERLREHVKVPVGRMHLWTFPGHWEIHQVQVNADHRRQGVASAMLDLAREYHPDVVHSGPGALTDDGAAWAGAYASLRTESAKREIVVSAEGHLWTWRCSVCGEGPPNRGYRDKDTAREMGHTHAQWCWDLGWDDEPMVREAALPPEVTLVYSDFDAALPRIRAEVDGEMVGTLSWWSSTGEVFNVSVSEGYRRQGVATAMWQLAKEHEPRLHHSTDLSEDGQAWSQTVAKVHQRTASEYATEEAWVAALPADHHLVVQESLEGLQDYAETVALTLGLPVSEVEVRTTTDQASRADYDYGSSTATISLASGMVNRWTVLHEMTHVVFLAAGSDEIATYHGPRFYEEFARVLRAVEGMNRTAKVHVPNDPSRYGDTSIRYELGGNGPVLDPAALPSTVYHVTTAGSRIGGVLHADHGMGGGLGGNSGEDRSVSFTISREVADDIASAMSLMATAAKEFQRIGRGEAYYDYLVALSVADGWTFDGDGRGWMSTYGSWDFGDWMRFWFQRRSTLSGKRDPLFFGVKAENWARVNPGDVGYVTASREDIVASGAMVTDFDLGSGRYGLQEIRVWGDVRVGGFTRAGAVKALASAL